MTGRVIDQDTLGQLSKVGQGGQGIVYRAPGLKTTFADSMVFKEYKPAQRATVDFTALSAMPDLVESGDGARLISVAAWPCAIVENSAGPSGFVMPSIPDQFFIPLATAKGVSPAAAEFQHLLNEPAVLASLGISIDDAQRYALLREVAGTLAFLHRIGVCVGDISPKNLLFSLDPLEAVYFIDCDAMRVNGVTALPQVETPGWEVPSGEDLATAYSDTYKLGLLALRLVAGDQQTTDVARIPATTPNLLRQIITDTLTNEPGRRPLPTAWTYILGHAIEEAQHRKTTTPAPAPLPASSPVRVRTRPKPTPAGSAGTVKPTLADMAPPSAPPSASLAANPWIVGGLAAAGVAVAVLFAIVIITAIGTHEISQPTTRSTATPRYSPGPSTAVAQPAATTPYALPNCGVNLAAPKVQAAVSRVPLVPMGWPWSTDPGSFEGNYNPCSTLSVVLISVEGGTGGSPSQAMLFHSGSYLGTATSSAYSFTSLNAALTTGDTVALDYRQPEGCHACAGPITTVRYQWQGNHVAMLGGPPPPSNAAQ